MGRMGRGWNDHPRYPKTAPRAVTDGVRAHSGREFGKNWWAKRWIAALEGLGLGSRLQRGRSYARRGQVVSIEMTKGHVEAKVQGSRRRPYGVTIDVQPLPEQVWQAVGREISERAAYAASLLSGEMPRDIEAAFERAGAALFPARRNDLRTDCTCPDWENPCKHVAAVFYLIGDELDRDPFLLFRLRGLDPGDAGRLFAAQDPQARPGGPRAEPLPSIPSLFWHGEAARRDPPSEVDAPTPAAPLLRRLGNPPFWRGSLDLVDALAPAYVEASARALALLAGDEVDVDSPAAPRTPEPSAPKGKSRDHAALEADIARGVGWTELARRYDGRILRPYRVPPKGRT